MEDQSSKLRPVHLGFLGSFLVVESKQIIRPRISILFSGLTNNGEHTVHVGSGMIHQYMCVSVPI